MTADCARLCLWCLIAPPDATPRQHPPPSRPCFVLLIFPSLTADTSSLHYCLGPARTPGESLASHRPHFKRNENTDRSVPSVSAALPPSPRPLPPGPPTPPQPPPFISLDKQCKAPRRLPPWISLSSPSGNVCWSFRVSCQTGWEAGGGRD